MRPNLIPDEPDATWSQNQTQYGIGDVFMSHASDAWIGLKSQFRTFGIFLSEHDKPLVTEPLLSSMVFNKPTPMPASKDHLDSLKKDRPGLYIPEDADNFLANTLATEYDDTMRNKFIQNHVNPTLTGTAANYAGSLVPALTNPLFLSGAGLGSKVAESWLEPLAVKALDYLGADELIGAGATETLSKLTSGALHGGTSMGLGDAANQVANIATAVQQQQPINWLDATHSVGQSFETGAILGFAFSVPSLLAGKAFEHMPNSYKDHIDKYWKPWSQNSDAVARQDSAGQSIEGLQPNVTATIKQGIADQARTFRQSLVNQNIDPKDFTDKIETANAAIKKQIDTLDSNKLTPQPFKDYTNSVANFLKDNPDTKITHDDLIQIFKNQYPQASVPDSLIKQVFPIDELNERDVSLEKEYQDAKTNNEITNATAQYVKDRLDHEMHIRRLEQEQKELYQQAKELKDSSLIKSLVKIKRHLTAIKKSKIELPKINEQSINYHGQLSKAVVDRMRADKEIVSLKNELEKTKNRAETNGSANFIKKAEALERRLTQVVNTKRVFPSVDDELEQIRNNLFDEYKTKNKSFKQTGNYIRLAKMARGNNRARNLMIESHLRHDPSVKRIYDHLKNSLRTHYENQEALTQSLLSQLRDENPDATKADLKEYLDNLNSNGTVSQVLPIGGDSDETLDEALAKFSDDQIQKLAKSVSNPTLDEQLEKIDSDLKQQPIYKKMLDELITCKTTR